ncbi:MAG: YceI family protein [Caulobacterales bacterium]
MRNLAFAALLMLAACATATAQPPAGSAFPNSPVLAAVPPSPDTSFAAADQTAGAYTLDSRHVSVLWRIRHLGLSLFTARFDSVNGTLNLDPQSPSNTSINITIAANSVNTGILNQQGERSFDNQIHTQAFGSAANPNITFVSTAVQLVSPTTALVTGNLTLNGVTKPVVLETTFEGGRFVQLRGKREVAFAARTIIKRSDFNANLSNPLANGTVSDEVEILIQAEFVKD